MSKITNCEQEERPQWRASEKWLHQATRSDQRVELLRTIPGLGELLATGVALEIDRVERFANPAKLAAYAGLVPTTYSSGAYLPRQANAAE